MASTSFLNEKKTVSLNSSFSFYKINKNQRMKKMNICLFQRIEQIIVYFKSSIQIHYVD